MSDEDIKDCPKCNGKMIKKYDYLPDDMEFKEPKHYWICPSCMYYEIIE